MRIQNTPRAAQRESYWLTQREANLIGCRPVWPFFCCSSNIMEAPSAAHCSMRIQNMAGTVLFFHIGA
jgi:hypothetical protein